MSDSQVKFTQDSDEELWEVIEIISAKRQQGKDGFMVKWAGTDPDTGKPWANSWVPREDCTDSLVAEWREKERIKKEKKKRISISQNARSRSSSTYVDRNSNRPSSVASSRQNAVASSSKSKSAPRNSRAQVIISQHKRKRDSSNGDEQVSRPHVKKKPRVEVIALSDTEDDDDDALSKKKRVEKKAPLKPIVGKRKLKQPADPFVSDEDDETEEEEEEKRPRPKIGPPRKQVTHASPQADSPTRRTRSTSLRLPLRPTQSQVIALRQEEEEETQPPYLLPPPAPPAVDDDDFAQEHESVPEDSGEPKFRRIPSLLQSNGHAQELPPPEPEEALQYPSEPENGVDNEGEEEDDRASIVSQAMPPPSSPPSASGSPAAPKQPQNDRPLRPIPQISPSVFQQYLPQPEDSSIEQFSPAKRSTQPSTVEEFDSGSGSGMHSRGEEIHQDWVERQKISRGVNGGPPKKRTVEDIMKQPAAAAKLAKATLSFVPFLGGSSRERLARNSDSGRLTGAVTSLQATQMQETATAAPTATAQEADVNEVEVQSLEERYVDFEGGTHADVSDEIAAQVNSQEEVMGTAPSKITSDESQSQPSHSQPSLAEQLATASNLLHRKSEEMADLKKQLDERNTQAEAQRTAFEKEREAWKVVQDEWTGKEQGWKVKAEEQATALKALQDSLERVQADMDTERRKCEEDKMTSEQAVTAARAATESAKRDADFFREQYAAASAFVGDTRAQNEELKKNAAIAEEQARDGVAMWRVTYEGRYKRLQEDVARHKATAELLAERGRRTDDAVRARAAMEPELRRQNALLEERGDLLEAEVEDLKEEMEGLRKKNVRRKREADRLRAVVERMKKEAGLAVGKEKEKERAVLLEDGDDGLDEDFEPGSSSSSSTSISPDDSTPSSSGHRPSGEFDGHGQVSGGDDGEVMLTTPHRKILGRVDWDASNPDVFRCRWQADLQGSRCHDAFLTKKELMDHVLKRHNLDS